MSAFYNLKAATPRGEFRFNNLQGKVVLIVNVASKCGFTAQYKGLQSLYDKYNARGCEIIGFPCNQFGSQEPGTDADILEFCQVNHGVTFPLMQKSDVNGDTTNEVFKYLKEEKAGALGKSAIKWNFEKFLIDREGRVVQRYLSSSKPEDIEGDITALL